METADFQRFFLISIGFVVFFGPGTWSQLEESTCENVRTVFRNYQFAQEIDMPENPISGAGLKVCRRERTCCTRRMEENLLDKSAIDFKKAIQTNIDYLDFLLSSNAQGLKDEYEELLRLGEAKIRQNFRIMYISIALDLDNDIRNLFNDLRDNLNGQEVKIQRSVRNFFDELFPLIYGLLDPSAGRLDALFSSCLSAKRAIIQPFGDIPRQIATLLYNSVETSRIVLQALQHGQYVLNATINMSLSKRCSRSLLEMKYCSICEAQLTAPPCQTYCLNVVKGCLANFMDLDSTWNSYVTSVIDLIRHSMLRDNDLQHAMNSLEYHFNDAINNALENRQDISYEVHRLCGYPSRGRPSPFNDFAAANPPVVDIPMVPSSNGPLDERLLGFVQSLDRSRGVYHNLPTMMCVEDELGSSRNQDCWTGHQVGEYLTAAVQNGLASQLHNPAVSWTGKEFELLQAYGLMDKLEGTINLIHWRLNSRNQNEDNLSGSGSGSGCYGDDEDCFSGSGDKPVVEPNIQNDAVHTTTPTETSTTEETDFHFDPTTRHSVKPTVSPLSSKWPFVPRGMTTHTPDGKTTPKQVENSSRSTTPALKDKDRQNGRGDAASSKISLSLALICLLASLLLHRH